MFEHLSKRLDKLEHGAGENAATLQLPDGSTAGIQCRDVLGLTLAAMRRQYAQDAGETAPVSKFDGKLNLLARAEQVETDDPLMQIAGGIAREGRANQ